MSKITSSLIKELRQRTGAGILECKKALQKSDGNIENSIAYLRKKGEIKSAKTKYKQKCKNGIILIKQKKNIGVMLELNCKTDFVAQNVQFINFGKSILDYIIKKKVSDLGFIKNKFYKQFVSLFIKFKENIRLKRVCFIEDINIISYLHAKRIGVLVSFKCLKGNAKNLKLVKKIAMHIAACKPICLRKSEISQSLLEKEYKLQLSIAKKTGKPTSICKKIVDGRMKKFCEEISLVGQNFIFDMNKKVGELLKKNSIYIKSFFVFSLGE